MHDIKDFDHFVLQPGEMLILRARREMSMEQMKYAIEYFAKLQMRVLIIPSPDFDIMAGIPMVSDPAETHEPKAAPEPESSLPCKEYRDMIAAAYLDGSVIMGRRLSGGRWEQYHRSTHPLNMVFDFNVCEYQLAK